MSRRFPGNHVSPETVIQVTCALFQRVKQVTVTSGRLFRRPGVDSAAKVPAAPSPVLQEGRLQ